MNYQLKLLKIRESRIFQVLVTLIILFSSVMVGVGTFDFSNSFALNILVGLDVSITIFFLIEILIRFFAEKKKMHFFKDGWNVFDLIVVVSSLIPSTGSSLLVLRLLRLARLLRIISFMPELRFVIEALVDSLKKSFYVLVLIFILLYIYAVAGVILFEDIKGGRFEDLGEALLVLVQIMTLSSWEEVMLNITDVYPYAWAYFVSFVVLSSIIVLNLFVAILVDVVSERRREELEKKLLKNDKD
jgi:voltage-gated sodium channel